MRQQNWHVGKTVWTESEQPYPLPPGIPNRLPVEILGYDEQIREFHVRAADGREWWLPAVNLEFGMEHQRGKAWVPESDSAVLDRKEQFLAEYLAPGYVSRTQIDPSRSVHRLWHELRRNGREPQPCPELAAWDAGRAAGDSNQPLSSNPHPAGSKLFDEWEAGWQDSGCLLE